MQKGLIIVNTGNGKGKTTAALGLAIRAWGQGLKVLILQFIKGSWKYGELAAISKMDDNIVIMPLGEGFTNKNLEEKEKHKFVAIEALTTAEKEVKSKKWDMIILDEINYALKYDLLELNSVLKLLDEKDSSLHLVLTGRDAKEEIISRADMVTEMKELKHHYKNGIKAQRGIEF
ncbi:MAG: cob(I)yrinic acid a,c-diamide adenosyltransferase [Negativicutes bacterium]|nr:cob(I)yrinic acid a,c-diamide adenosyltransferase [Negativicutes bacterium]MBP8629750.1 cob(I)yrinic acid a,c-diamide adenosyltransferase [Negativicutes bacterium]MBP9537569.1 cob(I)yrinic acid a,c-diamide adenosyltransferase [Negativicutes bacterium]MBP9949031.1 cob(I)yrinic acid a,c-diamide adenosyltransferase [Negativicutes bacterium]